MIRISQRIRQIGKQVSPLSRVVDVGTDHGLLPIYLVQRRQVLYVIASDLREGPLASAAGNIREAALERSIDVRRGNGLTSVSPGEVDTAVISGMGGKIIAEILLNSPRVVHNLKRLVLQPMGGAKAVRSCLLKVNFEISHEEIFRYEGKFYELIVAQPSAKVSDYDDYATGMQRDMALEFGPYLLKRPTREVWDFLKNKRDRIQKSLENLERSGRETAKERSVFLAKRAGWLDTWFQTHSKDIEEGERSGGNTFESK